MGHHAATYSPQSLLPISISLLKGVAKIDFDLIIREEGTAPRLYRGRDYPLNDGDIDRLAQRGVRTLYVSSDDLSAYRNFLKEATVQIQENNAAELFGNLKHACRDVFLESLACSDVGRIISATRDIGTQIVDALWERDVLLQDLIEVMVHDYSTFHHSNNVCASSVLMASELGIRDRDQLIEIAQGALLHDLGKRALPPKILNKRGPLNHSEIQMIKQHPEVGFRELCRRPDITRGQLMMVLQHHERCDGNGYPMRLLGEEIHPWGKLCAVADVFDALNRDRAYRRACHQADVLAYFDLQAGRAFDEEMVQCLIGMIQRVK